MAAPAAAWAAVPSSTPTKHPYAFRKYPPSPPTLLFLATQRLLARYSPKPIFARKVYPRITTKAGLERARRQLSKYFGLLNSQIKAELLHHLFNYRWDTYRQRHRTTLDKEMFDNDVCCTYPEECTGKHSWDLLVSNTEFIMIWKILVGKNATNLNLLPFLDQYHNSIMVQDMMFPQGPPKGIGWDTKLNLYRDIETELVKETKMVSNIRQIQFFATYRGFNSQVWGTLLSSMVKLQSLELHFWVGENFFETIRETCGNLRELILYRQRQGRASKDLEALPSLVHRLQDTLRVLVIDSVDTLFSQKVSKDLQKAVAGIKNLECLKLEADESPYVYWINSRYKVTTKRLQMSLRKSFQYTTIVRNINRCFNEDLQIELHFDTYVDIDNHKHAFFSVGPVTGGGENTVAQSTKDFEAREVGANFYRQFAQFGPRVVSLTLETDLRPDYFVALFPNVEEVEMFVRASRQTPRDARFTNRTWDRLTKFVMEVDPGFSSACTEYLLVHILGDLFTASSNLTHLKVLASQTGLKVSDYSMMLELNKRTNKVSKLREVVFLSPYRMQNAGLSHRLAAWFLTHCPHLQLLRDVCSWSGDQEDWAGIARLARSKGMVTGWADKTPRTSLYTIDYDSEGWVQSDTGHQFELYNNLNDDWEVVEMDNMDDIQIVDEAVQIDNEMEEDVNVVDM